MKNVFWKWAFDVHSETIAYSTMLLGFVIGCLKAGWIQGIVYAVVAPFVVLPVLFLLVAFGAIWQIVARKPQS